MPREITQNDLSCDSVDLVVRPNLLIMAQLKLQNKSSGKNNLITKDHAVIKTIL